jgi:hypothetical protein
MTRIFIEGYELDLTQGISNQITYAIDDLQNLDSKSTSFTKTIVLPGTAKNNNLLGNIFEFNNANFDNPLDPNVLQNFNAARNAVARIEIDGLQIMKGVLRLLEIVHVDGNIEYECALFGELGGFINALGNKRLEDLDFSAYNHTYSYANIVASWNTTGSTGYCYPLIDYGNVSTGVYGVAKKDFQYTTFKPALFVREYLNKIFSESGYTYECDLFNSNIFRNFVIPNNQKQLTRETNNVLVLTKATLQAMNTGGAQDFVSYPTKVGSLFTASVGNTTFTYTGTPILTTNLTIEILGDYTLARRPLTIALLKNGVIIPGSSQTYSGTDLLYYNKSLSVTFATNDTLRVRTSCILDIGDEVNVSESTINVINDVATTAPIVLGDTMLINNTIPKGIFQKDFVTSIIKMFNLMIVEDKYKTNHLIIKPYVDFYDGSVIDWSDKLDRSKAIKIKPMSEINARYYNFKYKQDNDFYNEDYRKKFNEGYGDIIYDNGLEFTKDTESVEIIFASSPLFGTASTDKIFPAIYKKSDNNLKEDPMDHILRIMQVKKISGIASWDILNLGTSLGSNTAYLYAGHLNDPTTPVIDINFGAPQQLFFNLTSGDLSGNLFNIYYSPYMSEITDKDSRLLTGFFDLKELDIFNLDFAKFIFIDGGLYRIIKVSDYNTEANETTKVELLRVIDKFSITIDTTPNWVSQSYNTCVSCTTYLVFRDLNPRSATYNNYRVNGVNVGNTAPAVGSCITTANWVSQAYITCVNCVNANVERDTRVCSATFNQYRANGVVLGLTAPVSGTCNVTPNFVNQGYNTCVNCVTYPVFRDTTRCSPTFNNYRVNGVNVGNTAPVNGSCNTSAIWTSQNYNTCYNCEDVAVFRDTNACSSTFNQYKAGDTIVGNTAPIERTCTTNPIWIRDGEDFCLNCIAYQPQIDNNTCSATYGETRNLSQGASSPCVYDETWTSQGYNTCVSCTTYLVYRNTNPCSATYNNYRVNGVNVGNTAPVNGSCNTTPNWVNNGAAFCSGCVAYQPQIDNRLCSPTYNQTRNLNLGATAPCNYTANYSSNVGNRYTCSAGVITTFIVYQNTNACFTGNQFISNGVTYSTNPSQSYPDTTPNWVNNGSTFCDGLDLYQPQINTNECSPSYNQPRNLLVQASSPSCAESYTMANCLGGGATTYSATYPIGSFSVGQRVTSSGVTYVITGTTTPTAGIVITATGFTGCPQYTQFTDLCTSNAYYILGTGYSSVGTSSDIPTACLQPTGTTETPTGTQIYNFTSNPSCECV